MIRMQTVFHSTLIIAAGISLLLAGTPFAALAPNPQQEDLQEVLSDHRGRIQKEFKIPEGLEKRVEFWLKIYTKYPSSQIVVHHKKYPWIIYDVLGTQGTAKESWANFHRLQRKARLRKREIKRQLRAILRSKSQSELTEEQAELWAKLEELPGDRKLILRRAIRSIRTQLGQRDFFMAGIQNGARYLPVMEKIFEQKGLPTQLTRLPLVESSFNENAYSHVGASGIWQIMPEIARHYNINPRKVDERKSPFKATLLAARLFKDNYKILEDWPMTVTSYNHGPGGLYHARRRLKTNNLAEIIERSRHRGFGFASKNFYAEFLAALYAERYQNELFGFIQKPEPLTIEVFRLNKSMPISKVASWSQLSTKELLDYNRDLRSIVKRRQLIPKDYRIILPQGHRSLLKHNILNPTQPRALPTRASNDKKTDISI